MRFQLEHFICFSQLVDEYSSDMNPSPVRCFLQLAATLFLFTSACNPLLAAPQAVLSSTTQSMRPVQFEDIITTEKPKLVTISPDSTKVAFVVEQSNIEENKVTNTLHVWDKKLGSSAALLSLDSIKKILWIHDAAYVLGQKEKEFQIYRIENATATLLVSSSNPISTFTAVNQNKLYYTQIINSSKEASKKAAEEGYVYRWRQDMALSLFDKEHEHYEFEEVWCLDRSSGTKQLLAKFDYKNFIDDLFHHYPLIEAIELSPDESKLAVNLYRLGRPELGAPTFCKDLVIFDIPKNKTYNLRSENQVTIKRNPCWINNNELVFIEEDYANKKFKLCLWNNLTNTTKDLDFDIGHERPTGLAWNGGKNLLIVSSSKALLRISLSQHTIEKITIPENLLAKSPFEECISFDKNLHFLASSVEDVNTLPQVVLYDLQSKQLTILTTLNADKKNIALGKIEPLTIKTKDSVEAKGFLIYPVDYKPGERYPLIIATYAFKGKRYALNAEEWHSSFPAQIFAKEGYFVLLLNIPPDYSQLMVNDSVKAREQCGWQPLNVFEQAVTTLVEKKLVDPNKVGLYGWSHGAFVVEFLISHSTKFQVASIGEGGDYNPGEFWYSGNDTWAKIFDNTFGGPPWGKTLKNYLDFSPFFYVEKIRTPLLMEFSGGALQGLEMYVPLRYLNIPAEFVVYDGEEHNFVKPKARLASMKRKVDWFNFWLFDKRDPTNPEQYSRWEQMRADFNKAYPDKSN